MRVRLSDGTGEMILKYVYEDVDRHGNVRIYVWRRGHKKVRLTKTPGTDEFLSEYRDALSGLKLTPKKSTAVGTFRWLAAQYLASSTYQTLDQSTKKMRRLHLDRISEKHGNNPIHLIRPKHIRSILDAYANRPAAARNTLQTIRALFKWAVARDYLDNNPARDVERPQSTGDGFHTWTSQEIRQYLDRHPLNTKAGLALAMLFKTRCRRSDVVKLGPQMIQDGWLRFTETKGSRRKPKLTEFPIDSELQSVLDLHQTDHLVFLVTEHGRAFTANGFGNWFRDRCREAGLKNCTAHGLRKANAALTAEAGASEFHMLPLFGWTSPKEAERYTRKANRKKLAAAAPVVKLSDQK